MTTATTHVPMAGTPGDVPEIDALAINTIRTLSMDAVQAAGAAAANKVDLHAGVGRESNGGGGEAAAPSPPRRVATRGGGRKGRAGASGAS